MTFLEANKLLSQFSGGVPLHLRFLASGNVDPLVLFIRASAAKRGVAAEIDTLPFGTFGQAMLQPVPEGSKEVIMLMPWDFVPECDWRSGIPLEDISAEELLNRAQYLVKRLQARNCKVLYLSAPLPPVFLNPSAIALLRLGLLELAVSVGAMLLDPKCFALGSYLASGVPVGGAGMSEVAEAVIAYSICQAESRSKVLITDLDNVMWSGVIAEDGMGGILCGPEGKGYRHFIYQSFLAKLKASGVLLAAVSRNDLSVALAPIETGQILLSKNDFVEILASYEPKSIHIRGLASRLNLGLDSFVFVDDNPIELAEVAATLPAVRCFQFPQHDSALPELLHGLSALFARQTVTEEDRLRTEMYRRRLALSTVVSSKENGADLFDFLTGLQMKLTINDRQITDSSRAIQLINKTNQFNLNGHRVTEEEVMSVLRQGGHLYTVKLDDRTGSHGEILACLVDAQGRILVLVLSCRVFQRKVEHAFLVWLRRSLGDCLTMSFVATERNTPVRDFLSGPSFRISEDTVFIDGNTLVAEYGVFMALFDVREDFYD